MTGRRARQAPRLALALLGVAGLAAAAVALLPVARPSPTPPPAGERPQIVMLTSLPIGFAGAASLDATLAADAPADPLLGRLADHVALTPVDALDAATLAATDTLFLAHPRALPPDTLVLIDDWLRGGGRALVLADGLSSWHAVHPLGDPRNPPVTSLLTPLLDRWGLRLDAPPGMAAAVLERQVGRYVVRFASPGNLVATASDCTVALSGMAGDCRIGRGRALVIADADFLDPGLWAGQGNALEAADSADNLVWLTDMLTHSDYVFPIVDTATARQPAAAQNRRNATDAG